jgi:hypothetical protein
MSNYRKYSFKDEAQYKETLEAIKIAPIEEVEQPQIDFIAIPRVCIKTPAIMVDGKITQDAVIDPNYSIDILWNEDEPKEFVPFQVWPKGVGQYIIGGWESAYEADRLAKFPIKEVVK